MNLVDKLKSVIYFKHLAELEQKLLEMQADYSRLDERRLEGYNQLKEAKEYIAQLEDKVSKLTVINKTNNTYIIKIQEAFQSKIDELKVISNDFFTF